MASLQSNVEDTGAIPPRLKRTMARDKVMGTIALGWWLSVVASVISLMKIAGNFGLFRPTLPAVSLAGATGGGYLFLALFAAAAGGVGLALTRFRPQVFFSVMVMGTAAVLVLSIMGLRDGWTMSGSTVVIRPAQFWKSDEVFRSENVTSTRRSCFISSVKGVGPSYNPVFIVYYNVYGRSGSWDADQSFTSKNTSTAKVARFVDAISAFRLKSGIPSETIGAEFIKNNAETEAGQRALMSEHQCVNYFTQILDEKRASEFRMIVGAE